jgi:hypothetical protein
MLRRQCLEGGPDGDDELTGRGNASVSFGAKTRVRARRAPRSPQQRGR